MVISPQDLSMHMHFYLFIASSKYLSSNEKSCHYCWINQNKNTIHSLFYQQIHFYQIKSKMTANNMSNALISPDVLSTLLLLQQGNIYKLQQKILHGVSRSSCLEVFFKKAALKTTHRIHRKTPVSESF